MSLIVAVSSLCVVAGAYRSVLPASDGSGEVMSADDAKKFPIVGSCVLFSAFLAFKFLPKSLLTGVRGGVLWYSGRVGDERDRHARRARWCIRWTRFDESRPAHGAEDSLVERGTMDGRVHGGGGGVGGFSAASELYSTSARSIGWRTTRWGCALRCKESSTYRSIACK